jgi:hypothetical protein
MPSDLPTPKEKEEQKAFLYYHPNVEENRPLLAPYSLYNSLPINF